MRYCDTFAVLGTEGGEDYPSSILEVLPYITIYTDAIKLAISAFMNSSRIYFTKKSSASYEVKKDCSNI